MSFSSFDLHADLLRRLEERGFKDPTPLQREVLPPALAGRDLLARASAGSGKTTALLLPVLQRLLSRQGAGGRALVVAAEARGLRRLLGEAEALASGTGLTWAEVDGAGANGAGLPEAALLAATPEGLEAHLGSLEGVEVVAVDEVDRLLEQGFQPLLERLLESLSNRPQTLLFAANLPAALTSFSEAALADPVEVGWRREGGAVEESILPVREELKGSLFLELLEGSPVGRAFVFTRTKHRANRLAEWLRGRGIPAERIHGNRSHRQRADALNAFVGGRFRVLVATGITFDAASGGDDPFHVVNYDVPNSADDYRERHDFSQGEVWTLVADPDESRLRSLERGLGRELPVRSREGFDYDSPPGEGMEVPMDEPAPEAQAPKKGRSRQRGRSKGKTGERRRAEPAGQLPQAAREPARHGDLDDDEEARIRQKAERMQEAAVAARLGRPQPWTAGWQEWEAQQRKNRPKRKSRGR